jgi:hypothetical protein
MELLECPGHERVRLGAAVGELRAVGDLVGERMAESVLGYRVEGLLDQQPCVAESPESGKKILASKSGDREQDRFSHVSPDHGRGLQ